ncbi:MAG: iron ABC transporter permease [Chloroflexi bacterium]|nr:MAG: iron ABC transporter permease [Chloroflexota bacterium]PIE82520.1 MAG: iron ABC transporter permease [Chloroflexota bacterium]
MTQAAASSHHKTRLIGSAKLLPVGLFIAVILLILGVVVSVTLGAAEISAATVYEALFQYDETQFEHLIIRTVRLPRVVAGVIIGVGLAVAGAIMQGLTINPLASPSILGISAGASFAVVLGVYLLGGGTILTFAFLAIGGAAVAAIIVYTLGSLGRGGATPVKLTLAGVIFAMFTSAFTTAVLVMDSGTFDQIRFWTVGSLAGRDWEMIMWLSPIVLVGLIGALLLSRQITTISLGQDIAKGLGQNTVVVKAAAAFMVILLAGSSVALAGPIGFVGLIIPHVVRPFCGVDYRWILPYSAVAGAMLVVVADSLGRVVQRPQEVPVGVMLAVVGAPFFIYLARWRVK